jgi:16S rRNA (guanine(527)-N(7))-methyltransferase RsmG
MDLSRIAALLEPFLDDGCSTSRGVRDVGGFLSPTKLDQISTYIDLLLRWNARINLTAIRDPEQIVLRHFGESLFMARHLFPAATVGTEGAQLPKPVAMSGNPVPAAEASQLETRGSKLLRVLDLGSGAGFPALPIKIWAPHIHLTMIESNQKKCAFLREAVRVLTLTNVDVIAERAESVAAHLPSTTGPAELDNPKTFQPADVVTFRAVEKFDRILPLATRFLAPNAHLSVLITAAQLRLLQLLPSITWITTHVPESCNGLLAVGANQVG